jgi:uncharacterized membrane protein HdeD (DUF308 family)
MTTTTPVVVGRHGSTLSILWGVLLVVFGFVAICAPFLAAVAVSAVVARAACSGSCWSAWRISLSAGTCSSIRC